MEDLLSGTLSGGREMIKAARKLIFPDQCPSCRTLLDDDGGLCGPCWRDTPFVLGLCCDLCGTHMIGQDPGTPVHCDACRSLGRPWNRGRTVMSYHGNARHMILAFKHGDRLDLAPVLARWMAVRAAPLVTPDTIVVPVPIHARRLLTRRFNQAAVLSRLLARHLGLHHIPDALRRVRATKPLSEASYADRALTLEDAIRVHPRRAAQLTGKPILLVDDVMTTGATFATCALQLQQCHARNINVMSVCRAPQHILSPASE